MGTSYNWIKLFFSLRFQKIDCFWCLKEDLCLSIDYELVHVVGRNDLSCCLLCGKSMCGPEHGIYHLVPTRTSVIITNNNMKATGLGKLNQLLYTPQCTQ